MKLIQWLKSLFNKESKPMTEPVTTEQPAVADPVAAATPITEATAGVKDLAKAYEFIKSGISHLGEAAEGELIALAKKYL
ncbi:hypothetical protein AI29_00235 [bacteria symbiont BFo2 of Frankliniella occidentalis]|nr:hypothetical protein AI29_00235 [bacteria symbiont BFo2 of Frankliniella occidentalis]KYP91598.1 hypothetical protein WB60_06495 [bacteria symbiont BFo2 of Frankliniella occidentalis]KYP96685.1 hypothetical protein WB67_01165 [bacteria symbiont BFo2 of Frankliniella occidentalis]